MPIPSPGYWPWPTRPCTGPSAWVPHSSWRDPETTSPIAPFAIVHSVWRVGRTGATDSVAVGSSIESILTAQPIPHLAHRQEVTGKCRIALELASQFRDVGIALGRSHRAGMPPNTTG